MGVTGPEGRGETEEETEREIEEREGERAAEGEVVSLSEKVEAGGGVYSDGACLREQVEEGGKAEIGCVCHSFQRV